MAELPSHYRAYLREFGVPRWDVLEAFEPLLTRAHRNIEYSVKVEGGVAHDCRLNVVFEQDLPGAIRAILDLLARAAQLPGVRLDLGATRTLLAGLDFSQVDLVACGLDARPERSKSRLKIWLSFRGQPGKFNEIVSAHGYDDDLLSILPGHELPCGVDLGFDGRTRVKIYPAFHAADLANLGVRFRLARLLPPAVLELADRCHRINLSQAPDGGRVIHFQPRDPVAFVDGLGHAELAETQTRHLAMGFELTVVSLLERELTARALATVNAYFGPRRAGAAAAGG